jgi:SAM-dependent methyltransferase
LGEAGRLDPDRDVASGRYWDSRARRYAARTAGTAERDPFLAEVRRRVGRRTTVVDVGAGTGRFSLALAPRAAEVVAVDPSAGMLGILRREAGRRGLTNLRCVEGRWEDVDVVADVAICSYVLPVVPDPVPFLRKLDRSSRRHVLLYLGAFSADALFDPLWRHFHGKPRKPGPTYLDLMAVLTDMGLSPAVKVVEVPSSSRFDSLAAAVREYVDYLVLPDSPQVRRELKGLLASWLVPEGNRWRLPVRTLPAAVVSWSPHGVSLKQRLQ